MHKGTDFAAPIGTAVYASGNAKVIVAGCCHGDAGTMIALQHDNGWVTHYFHLSKIMPGIVPGLHVTQGEKIGEVGMSGGHVTGPHLHYEVIINGEPVDPMKVPTEEGVTLAGAELAAFKRERDRIDAARASGAI
jgi:murein DD-endopeptidase MepM/ murein hydrolase activator NlpD